MGPAHVHDIVNAGPARATSIHVYSPPLRFMTFYDPVGRPSHPHRAGGRRRAGAAAWTPRPSCTPREQPVVESSAVERVLHSVRSRLDRVAVEDLADEVTAGALVVDIRPEVNRDAEGELRGAVVIERIHLEWRLDPTSPDRIAEAVPGRRVVVVCNEGYASSLAAASLRLVGVDRATDLIGGYRAWRRHADLHVPSTEEVLTWQ